MSIEPFVVRHYTDEEGPIIKGNGFDGLRIGETREEAEEFIAWLNERLAPRAPLLGHLIVEPGGDYACVINPLDLPEPGEYRVSLAG